MGSVMKAMESMPSLQSSKVEVMSTLRTDRKVKRK